MLKEHPATRIRGKMLTKKVALEQIEAVLQQYSEAKKRAVYDLLLRVTFLGHRPGLLFGNSAQAYL